DCKKLTGVFMKQILLFLSLVGCIVISRWVPHPINFTALISVALFSGSFWRASSVRFAIPLVAMFVSDFIIGFYPGIEINYLAIACCVLVAPSLNSKPLTIATRSFSASLIFFVISNLGVWLSAGLYPLTLQGLQTCFIMALPFYKGILLGALFYSFVLYGAYRLKFLELKYG
ncbi:hypothetical protein K2X05_14275, partial [bacterium]|nr:hypothetical protein [bacterium]